MPELADTSRRYVENTVRARLQGPGVERYAARARSRRGRGRGAVLAVALALGAALVAVMVRLVR
jgi:hypothetical protein